MKKVLLSLTMMLVVAVSAFAQQEVTVLTNSTASEWTGDVNGFSTTISGLTISYAKDKSVTDAKAPYADHIRVYKDATLTIQAVDGQPITNVILECIGGQKYCSNLTVDGADYAVANTTDFTISWTGTVSVFSAHAVNSQIRIKSIKVTTGAAPAVADPVFSPAPGTYYDALDVTVKCATEGARIYYTVDGSNPTQNSPECYGTIGVTETMSIKVRAFNNAGESSHIVEGKYVIASITEVASVAEFMKQTKDTFIRLNCPLTVVYQNGWNLFVQDESGAPLLVYGDVAKTYNNGDVIAAGVEGFVNEYQGHLQLGKPDSATFSEGTPGTAVAPITVQAADLNVTDHFNRLVIVKGVTVEGADKSITLSDASGKLSFYNKFKIEMPVDQTKKYDVLGIGGEFKGNAQIYIVEFKEASTGIENIETAAQVMGSEDALLVNVAEPTQVVVYNLVGQVVAVRNVEGEAVIPATDGIYLVKVGERVVKAIVK